MTKGTKVEKTLLPLGFSCSGVNSGIRVNRPDLGILISGQPAVVAGVFTRSQLKAAPVLYCQSLLPSENIRAIVTSSGQANAATGLEGIQNNLKMARAVAEKLGCHVDQVLTASTGPIGIQLEVGKIVDSISELIDQRSGDVENFALSILTTDLFPKSATIEVPLSKGKVRITGVCKGSGMIHPNMGTMLAYFVTDAKLNPKQAVALLGTSVDKSFNMISVDGETSTNDCVFLMANSHSQSDLTAEQDYDLFQKNLDEIMIKLAKSIARDGEGATKLIEVNLIGSPDENLAKTAARGLVTSPLVKTAIHGEDPNWGRILARLGADQVPSPCLQKMSLWLQNTLVYEKGAPVKIDLQVLRDELKSDTVIIRIDLKSGNYKATSWGCDLSKKYVDINATYLT